MEWDGNEEPQMNADERRFGSTGALQTMVRPIGMLIALAALGCSPAATPTPDTRSAHGMPSAAPKSLAIALEGEPENLVTRMGGGSASVAGNIRLAVHQYLVTYDDRGHLHPMLAEVPSQADGTWVVRPDGTMQTTYRLRPDVTWHDGKPLSPADFVLGWSVSRDPELPISSPLVARQVSQIGTPDRTTLVLEWSVTNPFANALANDEIIPLPVHLLQTAYEADKERFPTLLYWKREFVGVGPYQLVEWEPGSHLVLKAYDGFYAGRARIDSLTFRFLSNAPTVVANLLAGAVDGAIPRAVDFTQAMFVKAEWERAGRSPTVLVQPTHWRMLGVQFRVPQVRDVLDPRVRRALLSALDRPAMVETLLDGQAPVSDTFIPPHDARWEWVRDVVATYPRDPRRVEEGLTAAGWRKGADGFYANAGGRIALPVWTTAGEQNEQELAIIGDNWKAMGIGVEQSVLSAAQTRNNELRASFPGFDTTAIPLTFENTLQRVYGPTCPTEGSRWAGGNRGCYQNPEMDRLVEGLTIAIDPSDQQRLYRDLVRLQTEDLPVLPLYFNVQVTLFREGVTGVKGDTTPRTSVSWNIAAWDAR
jgi:peptide/nickel transport system substrate-binding protein